MRREGGKKWRENRERKGKERKGSPFFFFFCLVGISLFVGCRGGVNNLDLGVVGRRLVPIRVLTELLSKTFELLLLILRKGVPHAADESHNLLRLEPVNI